MGKIHIILVLLIILAWLCAVGIIMIEEENRVLEYEQECINYCEGRGWNYSNSFPRADMGCYCDEGDV